MQDIGCQWPTGSVLLEMKACLIFQRVYPTCSKPFFPVGLWGQSHLVQKAQAVIHIVWAPHRRWVSVRASRGCAGSSLVLWLVQWYCRLMTTRSASAACCSPPTHASYIRLQRFTSALVSRESSGGKADIAAHTETFTRLSLSSPKFSFHLSTAICYAVWCSFMYRRFATTSVPLLHWERSTQSSNQDRLLISQHLSPSVLLKGASSFFMSEMSEAIPGIL